MSERKLNKKEKFAATAQVKAATMKEIKAAVVPSWWKWLPAILGFIVYANTLGHGFALDDYAAILENTSTQRGLAAIGEIFRTSYRYGYILISDELYRPLPKAIFAACWDFFPNSATPGHWLNVLLFSFTCYVLYQLIAKWWPSQKQIALVAACLFAVHPLHTEVVANIKSLDEILAFLFGMLSLNFYFSYVQEKKFKYMGVAMVLYFCAFLCKESSITLLPLFPLMAWYVNGKEGKEVFSGFQYIVVPVVLFLLIRHQVLNSSGMYKAEAPSVADNMLMAAKDPLTRFTGAVAMMGRYLHVLLFPYPLTFDLSYPQVLPAPVSDWRFIISALALTAMLVMALMGMKSRQNWSFALLIFFITSSVSSNIFMLIGTHYGERLMYLPSLGIILTVSILLVKYLGSKEEKSEKLTPALMGAAAVVVLIYSGMTMARNPVWKDNGTLYYSGLTTAPNSARVQYYQGLYLVKPETLNTFPEAARDSALNAGIAHLKKSTELYPAFSDTWTQLGIVAYRQKNYPEALKYYDTAIRLNPYDPVIMNNSGSVYFDMQNYNEALKRFQNAVRIKADYADAYMNIGSCYGVGGQYELALQNFDKALSINPRLTQAYYMAGVTWKNMGNEMKANEYFQKWEQMKK